MRTLSASPKSFLQQQTVILVQPPYNASTKVTIFLVNNFPPLRPPSHTSFPSCCHTVERRYDRKFPPAATEITHTHEKKTIWALHYWTTRKYPPPYLPGHRRTWTESSSWEPQRTASVLSDLHELKIKSKNGAALPQKTTTYGVQLPHLQFGGSPSV